MAVKFISRVKEQVANSREVREDTNLKGRWTGVWDDVGKTSKCNTKELFAPSYGCMGLAARVPDYVLE